MKEINTLKDLREHAELTQYDMAEMLEITQSTYSRWERAMNLKKVMLRQNHIRILMKTFGIDFSDLHALIEGRYMDHIRSKHNLSTSRPIQVSITKL